MFSLRNDMFIIMTKVYLKSFPLMNRLNFISSNNGIRQEEFLDEWGCRPGVASITTVEVLCLSINLLVTLGFDFSAWIWIGHHQYFYFNSLISTFIYCQSTLNNLLVKTLPLFSESEIDIEKGID